MEITRNCEGELKAGDRVYLSGMQHCVDNEGVVTRVWANGFLEVSFDGWTWVGPPRQVDKA